MRITEIARLRSSTAKLETPKTHAKDKAEDRLATRAFCEIINNDQNGLDQSSKMT